MLTQETFLMQVQNFYTGKVCSSFASLFIAGETQKFATNSCLVSSRGSRASNFWATRLVATRYCNWILWHLDKGTLTGTLAAVFILWCVSFMTLLKGTCNSDIKILTCQSYCLPLLYALGIELGQAITFTFPSAFPRSHHPPHIPLPPHHLSSAWALGAPFLCINQILPWCKACHNNSVHKMAPACLQ